MCVNFRAFNKAYPKNCYPLPHVDQLVDTISGNELLRFIDAYSNYNQIWMLEKDAPHTTFFTNNDITIIQ